MVLIGFLVNCLQHKYFITTNNLCSIPHISRGREMLRSCFCHFLYIRKKFKLDLSSRVKHVRSGGGNTPNVPLLKLTTISPHSFLQQRHPLSTILPSTARGPSQPSACHQQHYQSVLFWAQDTQALRGRS